MPLSIKQVQLYVEVIIKRWEEYTGAKAEKI